MALSKSAYFGETASFPTMHGKEAVVSPVFENVLGVHIELAGVDTDSFGTFSGETPRALSQLDTAIAKARAAIDRTGRVLAIASEGTIGPHPVIPIASSDFETLVFIDSANQLIIHQSSRSSEIITARTTSRPGDDLDEFLVRADFPNHGLIVRTEAQTSIRAIKGIVDRSTLETAIWKLAQDSGSVIIESDLRACFSPSRMRNIAECAKLLAGKIAVSCPKCNTPGWGSVRPIFGVPCGDCGELVESAVLADRLGCVRCDFVQASPRLSTYAEARFCRACNP